MYTKLGTVHKYFLNIFMASDACCKLLTLQGLRKGQINEIAVGRRIQDPGLCPQLVRISEEDKV